MLTEDAAVFIVDWEARKALELNRIQIDQLLRIIRKRKK